MRNIIKIKIIAVILLVFNFNLNVADNSDNNSEHESLSLWSKLPEELRLAILEEFVSSSKNSSDTDFDKKILEEIEALSNLLKVNKILQATEFLRNALDKKVKYLDNLVKKNGLLEVALKLKIPLAAKWLKSKAFENQELQEKINQALIQNAENGNQNNVKFLINSGADVEAQDNWRYTALAHASQNGYKGIVEILIKAGASVDSKDITGVTALVRAIQRGYKNIVKVLINSGADIETQDNWGDTALMRAAKKGYPNIIKVLIKAGANVNVKSNHGFTALMSAAGEAGQKDIVESSISNASIYGEVMYSSSYLGFDIDISEYEDVVKLLIRADADVNAKNKYGLTALDIAKDRNRKKMVKFLKKEYKKLQR